MTRTQIGRETARLLLEAGAIHVSRQQPFILAAGWASPVYVDGRRLVGELRLRKGVTDVTVQYAGSIFSSGIVDAVTNAETAGIPCSARFADGMRLKLWRVRKRPLGIGRNAQVEGGLVEG
jgi:orotate phosphoribosyltransferase